VATSSPAIGTDRGGGRIFFFCKPSQAGRRPPWMDGHQGSPSPTVESVDRGNHCAANTSNPYRFMVGRGPCWQRRPVEGRLRRTPWLKDPRWRPVPRMSWTTYRSEAGDLLHVPDKARLHLVASTARTCIRQLRAAAEEDQQRESTTATLAVASRCCRATGIPRPRINPDVRGTTWIPRAGGWLTRSGSMRWGGGEVDIGTRPDRNGSNEGTPVSLRGTLAVAREIA